MLPENVHLSSSDFADPCQLLFFLFAFSVKYLFTMPCCPGRSVCVRSTSFQILLQEVTDTTAIEQLHPLHLVFATKFLISQIVTQTLYCCTSGMKHDGNCHPVLAQLLEIHHIHTCSQGFPQPPKTLEESVFI